MNPRDESSFTSEEEFQEYLFATGSLYNQLVDNEVVVFMDREKCELYAPEYYRTTIEAYTELLAKAVARNDGIEFWYEPEIKEDGTVELNPHFDIPEGYVFKD